MKVGDTVRRVVGFHNRMEIGDTGTVEEVGEIGYKGGCRIREFPGKGRHAIDSFKVIAESPLRKDLYNLVDKVVKEIKEA